MTSDGVGRFIGGAHGNSLLLQMLLEAGNGMFPVVQQGGHRDGVARGRDGDGLEASAAPGADTSRASERAEALTAASRRRAVTEVSDPARTTSGPSKGERWTTRAGRAPKDSPRPCRAVRFDLDQAPITVKVMTPV